MTSKSVHQRFWEKVDKSGECWLWTGAASNGYGEFWYDGERRKQKAYRVAYEWARGPVPTGLELDHLCEVRECVNPAHLEAVPHRVNTLRGNTVAAKNALKTHCPAGHEYSEENTYQYSDGRRQCRICRRASQRAGWRRQQDAIRRTASGST